MGSSEAPVRASRARVNPIAPIPSEFGVKVVNPAAGQYVYFDDCFRSDGDRVDGDIMPGEMVEAKGPRPEFLYADARGVGSKWYFAAAGLDTRAAMTRYVGGGKS